jgi:hypothetical protein
MVSKKEIQKRTDILNKRIEIKDVKHEGIKITVTIDYIKKVISLVEPGSYSRKDWRFTDRGLSYMQGWQNILDAMKHAIKVAEKDLKEYEDFDMEYKLEFSVALDEKLDNKFQL